MQKSSIKVGIMKSKPVLHFIQPYQYFKNSKTYTDEEIEKFLTNKAAAQKVSKYYPLIIRLSQELSKNGIPSYDLSMIFKNIDKTLYIDAYCHLNESGTKLITEKIIEHTVSSGILNSVPSLSLESDKYKITEG